MARFENFIKEFEQYPLDDYDQSDVDFYYNYLDLANGWDGWRFIKQKDGSYAIKEPDYEEPTKFRNLEESKKDLHDFRYEDPDFRDQFNEYRENKKKAKKLIALGEKPFGNHTYFYEKDGNYYSSGFDNDGDKKVSLEDMAKIYDEQIESKKPKKKEKIPLPKVDLPF